MSEIAHDPLVDESYTGKIARLESELAAAQERISTLLTGIQIIEQNKIKAAHAYADSVIAERRRSDDAVETGRQLADYNMKLLTLLDNENKRADAAEKDAKRYRLLRQYRVDSYMACGIGDELDKRLDDILDGMKNG